MSQGQANANYAISTSQKVSSIFAGDYAAADEGSFFVASRVTTAMTASVDSQAKSQVTPALVIQNQQPLNSGYNMYLRYIKLVGTTIPTAASDWQYTAVLDPLSTKLTTAASVITPVNVNSNSGVLSAAYISFGANTVVTTSAAGRIVAAGYIAGNIPVAKDEYLFDFGQPGGSVDSVGTHTLLSRVSIPMAPVIIAPQWFFTLGLWGTSYTTAASYSIEMGFVERPAGQ